MKARQSTAFETSIGPVLDADGVAFEGAVVGDFQIKKNGADWAALNGSATATHTTVGHYDLVLTTSDLDTVGVAAIRINDGVNACATLYLQVIEEAVYDALYAASAVGPLLANSDGSGLTEAGGTGDHLTDLPTAAEIVDEWETQSQADPTGFHVNVLEWTGNAVTASGGNPDVNVESIDDIDAPATWEATIQAAVTGGAYALDTDANGRIRIVDGTGAGELDTSSGLVTLTTASVNAIADQVWEEALADHEGTAGSTAEALADAGGSGASAADIADAVWDEATAGHVAAGSFGKLAADVLEDTGTTIPALFPANFSTLTIASNAVLAKLGDLAHGGTSAVLTLERLIAASTTSNEPAVKLTGNGTAAGAYFQGGATGHGILGCGGATSGAGMLLRVAGGSLNYAPGGGDGLALIGSGSRYSLSTNSAFSPASINAATLADDSLTAAKFATDSITDDAIAASAVTEIQSGLSTLTQADVTGGAYALDTDANGRIRVVDGTGAGEIDTTSGGVAVTAASVRAALGMASASYDTDIAALPTAAENAAALLDLTDGIESSVTPRQALRGIAAALFGIVSGAATGTEVFKGAAQASGGTTRLTYTVDSSGNRSAITLNL